MATSIAVSSAVAFFNLQSLEKGGSEKQRGSCGLSIHRSPHPVIGILMSGPRFPQDFPHYTSRVQRRMAVVPDQVGQLLVGRIVPTRREVYRVAMSNANRGRRLIRRAVGAT